MHRPGTRVASFTLSCLVALLLGTTSADARERTGRSRMGAAKSGQAHRTVTRTGPDGTARTSTHDTTWQRSGGKYARDTVHTGPNGGVTTRSATGSYDPATKTFTRDATTTRPDGSKATSHTEGARTDGGYQQTTTHTGPKGTTTIQGKGEWDPETKTWTREKVVTRPDGSTSTTEVTTQVTPNAPQSPVEAD